MSVGTPTTSTGNSTTPAVAVPSGVASGDIVLLLLSVDNLNATMSTSWPSGFTNLHDTQLTLDGHRVGAAWKRLTGADSGSYTMTTIGASGGNYGMAAIPLTGRHAANPPVIGSITANNSTNAGTSLTETATGVTAVAGDDVLHVAMEDVAAANIGNGHSAWSIGTEIVDLIDAAAGWSNIGVAKVENIAAGATGNETVTFTKSPTGNNGYCTYLIRVPAAAGGSSSFNQSGADSVAVTDSSSRLMATARSNSDAVGVTDATSRVVGQPRATSDSTTITDAPTTTISRPRGTADSIVVTDVLMRSAQVQARATGDALSVVDSTSRVTALLRGSSDAVAITDAVARSTAATRSTGDSLALSDASSRSTSTQRTTGDLISLSAALSRAVALVRSLTASVAMSDAVARLVSLPRAISDALSILDTTGTAGSGSQAGADSIAVSDSSSRSTSRSRVALDSVALDDALSRGALVLQRSTADALVVGGAVSRSTTSARSTSNIAVISSTVVAGRATNIFAIDSITIGTGASRSTAAARVVGETTSLTDASSKITHASQFAFDIINMNDVVVVPIEFRKLYAASSQGASIKSIGGRLRVGGAASQSSAISTIGTRT